MWCVVGRKRARGGGKGGEGRWREGEEEARGGGEEEGLGREGREQGRGISQLHQILASEPPT